MKKRTLHIGKALRRPVTPADLVDVLRFEYSGQPTRAFFEAWHKAHGDGGTTYGPWRLYHLLLEEIEE